MYSPLLRRIRLKPLALTSFCSTQTIAGETNIPLTAPPSFKLLLPRYLHLPHRHVCLVLLNDIGHCIVSIRGFFHCPLKTRVVSRMRTTVFGLSFLRVPVHVLIESLLERSNSVRDSFVGLAPGNRQSDFLQSHLLHMAQRKSAKQCLRFVKPSDHHSPVIL